ncbi:MAG: SRPBCC family protein [Acidimicrobiales bacterium]
MTVRFERSVFIDAAIDRVFALSLSVDFHLDSFADTGEQVVGGVRTGMMALGDEVTWRAKHFGIWWELTSVITEFDPPYFFVDEQQRGPFSSYRHEHIFVSHGTGTEMRDVVEFRAPLGPLGVIAERLVLRRHLEDLIDLRNEELRTIAEA